MSCPLGVPACVCVCLCVAVGVVWCTCPVSVLVTRTRMAAASGSLCFAIAPYLCIGVRVGVSVAEYLCGCVYG